MALLKYTDHDFERRFGECRFEPRDVERIVSVTQVDLQSWRQRGFVTSGELIAATRRAYSVADMAMFALIKPLADKGLRMGAAASIAEDLHTAVVEMVADPSLIQRRPFVVALKHVPGTAPAGAHFAKLVRELSEIEPLLEHYVHDEPTLIFSTETLVRLLPERLVLEIALAAK